MTDKQTYAIQIRDAEDNEWHEVCGQIFDKERAINLMFDIKDNQKLKDDDIRIMEQCSL